MTVSLEKTSRRVRARSLPSGGATRYSQQADVPARSHPRGGARASPAPSTTGSRGKPWWPSTARSGWRGTRSATPTPSWSGRPASSVSPTSIECPICEDANVVLVSYVFGPGLPPFGRCISSKDELAKLKRRPADMACYVVEVCPNCSWNHLARVFPGRPGRADAEPRATAVVTGIVDAAGWYDLAAPQ